MMDVRVPAAILVMSAKASDAVAKLERLQAETPNLRGNSDQRIRIGRRLKVARELAESWQTVLALVSAERFAESEERRAAEMVCELKAPERVVAQIAEVEGGPNLLYCNRAVCYHGMRPSGRTRLVPLTSDDLPDGGICDRCGTDVLA